MFDIAEEHMGVPRLLEPSEMLSGDPDERAIQLYVSLLFDAFSLRKVAYPTLALRSCDLQ